MAVSPISDPPSPRDLRLEAIAVSLGLLGCALTFCVFLGHADEPFRGHPSVVQLLFLVAMPAAAATLWTVAGWHFLRHRMSGRCARRPGFSWCVVGVAVALINMILLILLIAAYLSDIAAYGDFLRSKVES